MCVCMCVERGNIIIKGCVCREREYHHLFEFTQKEVSCLQNIEESLKRLGRYFSLLESKISLFCGPSVLGNLKDNQAAPLPHFLSCFLPKWTYVLDGTEYLSDRSECVIHVELESATL